MGKYSQTLTANSYTAQDINTRLKEAMDNLGWGTGKVDILGGYRFTATDETNSLTTPLVINSSDFIEGVSCGKNIIHYQKDRRFAGCVAMYLPGVKSFRVKYTIKRYDGAAGSVNWNSGENHASNRLVASWLSNGNPVNDTQSYSLGYNAKAKDVSPSGSTTTDTQITSAWCGGGLGEEISGFCTFWFSNNDPNSYIQVDAIEWTVDQNKFAFQSPNLDSPLFELYTRTYSGNALTTLVALPIKNAKTPLVRIELFPTQNNTVYRNGQGFKAHSQILFNTFPDSSIVGIHEPKVNCQIVNWSTYSQDLMLNIGSNTSFDGFYLTTTQGSNFSGAVWDTVNKASGFQNNVPQYPAVRKTAVNGYDYGGNSNSPYWYNSNASDYWVNNLWVQNDVFEVKNTCNISEVQTVSNLTGGRINDNNFYQEMTITLSRVTKNTDGTYSVKEVLASGKVKSKILSINVIHSLPVNKDLAPGLYVASYSSPIYRSWNDDGTYRTDDFFDYDISHKSRDISFLGQLKKIETSSNPIPSTIRYIRETLSGSSVNSNNHWVEIQALVGGVNVAKDIVPIFKSTHVPQRPITLITDGNVSDVDAWVEGSPNTEVVTIDLGSQKAVDTVKTWHYWGDSRRYNTKVEVSSDGVEWFTLFSGQTPPETSAGNEYKVVPGSKFLYEGITPNLNSNFTNKPSAYSSSPAVCSRLVQNASGTPVSTRTMFAENWFSIGKVNMTEPYVMRPNLLSGEAYLYQTGGSLYDSFAFTRFIFGLDIQMINWSTEDYFSSPAPGSSSMLYFGELNNYNNTHNVEFSKSTSKFSDGRPYRKAWFFSSNGTALQANNLFILNGVVNVNSSYVTAQDGREYVSVVSGGSSTRQSYAFRLR